MNPDFARAILLKVGFHADRLRRAQAGVLLLAMREDFFRADELPAELWDGDSKLPGATFGALSAMGLIRSTGIINSPSRTRHGGLVRVWKLAEGKLTTARTWLRRNGFADSVPEERQPDLLLTQPEYPR